MRVLLVDDSEELRLLLRLDLRWRGFDVVGEASDGSVALSLAGELQPDAIVLDIDMPEMDGLRALTPLRRLCPGARLVVFTDYQADELRSLLDVGGCAVVGKGEGQAALAAALVD